VLSTAAMFFIDETYASTAVCLLVFLFMVIHYMSPPKSWGDVSQNLIYHQVRKYLLRLKPEHIKFWRPQIILLINNPRRQTRLIQFCNSMKKGALYILGHVIVTDDFSAGVAEAKLQQSAWTKYISEYSRIKAFVQLSMSPSLVWGVRNLILSAGLGGMRPNIAVLGFYNMDEFRRSRPGKAVFEPPLSSIVVQPKKEQDTGGRTPRRRRGDTSSRLLEGYLPTDDIKTEGMTTVTNYMTILEDLALRYRLNVAVGKGFEALETPRKGGGKTCIDLWPIQMSAELSADGGNVLTTNFDTCESLFKRLQRGFADATLPDTLILQLGYILHTVPTWKKHHRLRVLVFVEYESELDEERGRVKALLDKLRIEAEVLVFWLASGELLTYETIVQGNAKDTESETLVNECLKGQEWWADLQRYRGSLSMTASQELDSMTHVIESTSGRPGLFNPHSASAGATDRQRPSWAQLNEFPQKPTVSRLVKMGVSMSIHTQNLPVAVFDSSDADGTGSDSESDSSHGTDGDFNDEESVASEGDMELEPTQRPLLAALRRRRSYGDVLTRHRAPKKSHKSKATYQSVTQSYGSTGQDGRVTSDRGRQPWKSSQGSAPLFDAASSSSMKLERPTLSRHGSSAMRFSSMLVPQTTITNEGGAGPRIMFAEADARPEKPACSRQPSVSRFPNKATSDTRLSADEGRTDKSVSFAQPVPEDQSPTRSLGNSTPEKPHGGHDALVDIPGLLSTYQFPGRRDDETGSSYSTQSLALSFNDLPSRAQHLILNELMRQHSGDTAVLFTTLPIPEEGTCQSEEASIGYLSDVEVLCNQLPPVLLVLSNNMTVTVGL